MTSKLKFKDTTADEMYRKMILLDSKKATLEGDVSVELLKCIADIIAGTVADIFNENKNKNVFPSSLKRQNVTPLHKGEERTAKKNTGKSTWFKTWGREPGIFSSSRMEDGWIGGRKAKAKAMKNVKGLGWELDRK